MDALTNINSAIAALAGGQLLSATLVLAAAGTLAMAILQIIKELTPLRRRFQENWLTRWIVDRGGDGATVDQLVDLATGGDRHAFFELSTEQLVAQMNAAAQIVLDYPERHFALLKVLAKGTEVDMADVRVSGVEDFSEETRRTLIEARSRIGNRIQRNLDGLQISMGSRWRWHMQFASIVLTVVLVEFAVVTAAGKGADLGIMLIALCLGIAGGYLAPVTRDLVAALQSLRK